MNTSRNFPLITRLMPNHIPLRDFFRNPEKTSYRISPDGKFVSHTEPFERRMNVFVEPRGEIGQGKSRSRDVRNHAGYYELRLEE